MNTNSRSPRRAAIALVAVATLLAVPTIVLATHAWGPYHWARTANPFTLKLGDNMTTADWKSHLAQTSSDWNAGNNKYPQVLLTSIVPGTTKGKCRPVSGTTQVCNGSYGNNGWLGLATIYITGGVHITQGTA